MALLRRKDTGLGDYVDVACITRRWPPCPNVMGPAMARQPQPILSTSARPAASAFYQIYATSDGRHLVLGAQEMKFVRNLLDRLGRPELAELCERGPGRASERR